MSPDVLALSCSHEANFLRKCRSVCKNITAGENSGNSSNNIVTIHTCKTFTRDLRDLHDESC